MLIICFGDSLTAGFQSPGPDNPQGRPTPYGEWVQEFVGSGGLVRTSGVCGEVTAEMVSRFRRDVLAHRPNLVVILGGTNDLGWNVAPEAIVGNLVKLYEQTLAAGGVPVPVTVPSIRVDGGDGSPDGKAWIADHLARRHRLNGLIEQYARLKRLAWIDLFEATADPDSRQLAAVYSNDGLHLTTAGYRLLADLVYTRAVKPALV
jgi:lysophospholipase L1-like esterase